MCIRDRLYGPQRAQPKVMQQYQMLSQLLRPMGFTVVGLQLRERGSWFLSATENASGQRIEILLGRDHVVDVYKRQGRLILEQSTWTAHNRIEALATERLKMHIPDPADVRMVRP